MIAQEERKRTHSGRKRRGTRGSKGPRQHSATIAIFAASGLKPGVSRANFAALVRFGVSQRRRLMENTVRRLYLSKRTLNIYIFLFGTSASDVPAGSRQRRRGAPRARDFFPEGCQGLVKHGQTWLCLLPTLPSGMLVLGTFALRDAVMARDRGTIASW
jgi:hypothetical protein